MVVRPGSHGKVVRPGSLGDDKAANGDGGAAAPEEITAGSPVTRLDRIGAAKAQQLRELGVVECAPLGTRVPSIVIKSRLRSISHCCAAMVQ